MSPKKAQKQAHRCEHTSADGRRCSLLPMKNRRYCLTHWNSQQLFDAERVSAELLGSLEDFKTVTSINQALGKLFALVAGNRIPPRHAALLAYIAQLLLQTQSAVQNEFHRIYSREEWQKLLGDVLENDWRETADATLAEKLGRMRAHVSRVQKKRSPKPDAEPVASAAN